IWIKGAGDWANETRSGRSNHIAQIASRLTRANGCMEISFTCSIPYMDRRQFLENSLAIAISGQADRQPARGRSRMKVAAYYLAAHIYTSVPRHIREDMAWMADKGTNYVCVSVLEQDLFAAYENQELIVEEAGRVGMQVLAVPSRWGGLTAGAPKV